jgi:acyl-CoA dehydrogenase
MIATATTTEPGRRTGNRIMTGRTLLARAAIGTVERAMELAGGSGFYRAATLERHFRDIQAARYHNPTERMQQRYAGYLALGLDANG